MATFTPEELEFIKVRGNDYCRRVWLGLYEGESVNLNDEQSIRDFMSDKYEKKRYYLESASNTAVVTNGNVSVKSKTKGKLVPSNTGTTSLISIAPQIPKSINNNTSSIVKSANNLLPTNEVSYKIPRPVNNVQPLLSSIPLVEDITTNLTTPVPE